jgi:hypothetical protein
MFADILKVDNITQLIAGIVMALGSIALFIWKFSTTPDLVGMLDLESLGLLILFIGGIQITVKRGLKKKSS